MADNPVINVRRKSPTRAEAFARAIRPQPEYSTGVLLGNWVEDRIECVNNGTLYFPPKDKTDYDSLKRESRTNEFRLNRLNSLQGNVNAIIEHDSHKKCGNYATTNDLVYNHLPKPLCGPNLRYYKKCEQMYYPQTDLTKCYGNVTEWGLQKYKSYEWKCTDVSDYSSTLYSDTFVSPHRDEYLQPCERKARDSSFTKTFRFKMSKPISQKKQ